MKLFRKFAAAALAGVMALSLLTGCALGDAAKENAMLKALQTVGNIDSIKVSEDKDLSKKTHDVFSAFKTIENMDWSNPCGDNPTMYVGEVTYKGVQYIVAVTEMPKNAKDSINWGHAAAMICDRFNYYGCVETDKDGNSTLKVGFDVMNDTKLIDTQEKSEDYMVVFAKIPEAQDGGDIAI